MSAEAAYRRLYDRSVRHRIALERYSAGEVRRILAFLREVETDALKTVAALTLSAESRAERLRLESLRGFLRELRLIYAEAYQRMTSRLIDDLGELATFEAEFRTASLDEALDDLIATAGGNAEELRALAGAGAQEPTASQIVAVINSRPLQTDTRSALLSAWLEDMEAAGIDRIESAIRIGFVEGESIEQLRERLSGVWRLNERGAEAVIRTAVTHVAAEVAQLSYEENPDLVNEIEWVSVLDSRTTPICRARDGKRYPVNGGPRPPAHIRCRSTIVPVIADFPPPERLTYGDWLRRQPQAVQDDILGPARARAFRAGELRIDAFTADDGRVLTLDQLREAFPRARRSLAGA